MAIFISIHAPTRGATKKIKKAIIWYIISIHAPTRGATGGQLQFSDSSFYFNPRSYKRSDDMAHYFHFLVVIFQSTLLQEERRISYGAQSNIRYFNPRSYKRSDSKNAQYSLCISAIIIA